MDYEEAMDYIACALPGCCTQVCNSKYRGECTDEQIYEALETIRKAVEKQTKQKPGKESEDGWILLFCQKCKKNIEFGFDRPNYCPECGQAIDWGEEE